MRSTRAGKTATGAADAITVLKNVPLFGAIPKADLQAVRSWMHECTFTPGEAIIREGERGDVFHVVTRGQVVFTTTDAEGREIVLDRSGAGGFFGELSMLTGDPRSAGVRAVDDVETLSLDRRGFQNFLMEHPRAALDMLAVVARRLSRADALLRQTLQSGRAVAVEVAGAAEWNGQAAKKAASGGGTRRGCRPETRRGGAGGEVAITRADAMSPAIAFDATAHRSRRWPGGNARPTGR